MDFPVKELKRWFLTQRRDLPWRESPSPYQVWISEVMLQQTRVAVVLRYYEEWMRLFPDIRSLASASVEKVIKAWEGLGYYSRARNIHTTAKELVKMYEGEFPKDQEKLKALKGFGPYTIGALRSFAFHQKAAAVDGNVVRVIARYFSLEEEIEKTSTKKAITALVENLLPEEEPWVIMEALIELGATVCNKKALCHICPLHKNCVASKEGKEDLLPKKRKREKTIFLFRHVAVIVWEDEVLIAKEPSGKIMADLYQFPYFEVDTSLDEKTVASHILSRFSLQVTLQKKLEKVSHSFTKFEAHLYPTLWKAVEKRPIGGFTWTSWKDVEKLPFSSGYKKILTQLKG